MTYNHHPLYFYSADKHGKIMCQHAVMHGGIWLVLKANGTPNMMKGKMHMYTSELPARLLKGVTAPGLVSGAVLRPGFRFRESPSQVSRTTSGSLRRNDVRSLSYFVPTTEQRSTSVVGAIDRMVAGLGAAAEIEDQTD